MSNRELRAGVAKTEEVVGMLRERCDKLHAREQELLEALTPIQNALSALRSALARLRDAQEFLLTSDADIDVPQ